MRGRIWLTIVGIAIVAVPWTSSAVPFVSTEPGLFWVNCGFSHRLADDPIVYPRRPGASHSHDFFGNRSTNARSTYSTLRSSSTLCHRSSDASAYWVPTLIQNGKALKPIGLTAYYLPGRKQPGNVRAFPAGLRMIAGNGRATKAQATWITSWSCTGSSERSSEPPTCGSEKYLRMHVSFPDCWNGRNLDAWDHRSHMAYSNDGCPSGYPVAVPLVQFAISYPTSGGGGISLASGSRYTGHGDFFNAWDQSELQRLVDRCINRGRRCGQN